MISAEIRNENVDKGLYDIEVKQYDTWTLQCTEMKNHHAWPKEGAQSNDPRLLVPNTSTSNDGHPQYSRISTEDGGKTAIIKKHNGTTIEVDNQWVVPVSMTRAKRQLQVKFVHCFFSY